MLHILTEDTTLLLTLVAVISGGVVIMAVLLIVLHCRRLRVRTKGLGAKVTEAAEGFTDQEIWPGHEVGECDNPASESKVSVSFAGMKSGKVLSESSFN